MKKKVEFVSVKGGDTSGNPLGHKGSKCILYQDSPISENLLIYRQ